MIAIMFNHDMRDDPYNQNAVNKGSKKLEKLVCELGEKMYCSFGFRRDAFCQEKTDECVFVYHSCDLNAEQKKQIAENIREILTLKKVACGKEKIDTLILFEKKETDDVFVF